MQLYNTLNRQKEPFAPSEENHVRMYVCGITAYDLCHIGHARSAVVFDVLVRYFFYLGYNVTFARNFTDIDDKIIKRANELGVDSRELAEKYIEAFYEDMDALNVLRATLEPKCTEHIPEMIGLTETLIEKGKAYPTPSGDVYFRVRAFDGYGKLSGRNVDDMRSGARIAPGDEKEDPLDFALWKAAKPDEPAWDSPWGRGRPGWHLECSAMSEKYFTLPLDIHGGGQDLIFPHHENEIAQSEAAADVDFVRCWVHNGFVQVDSEKMSKSLGNFRTIRDILESYLPDVLRYFLLTKHYRSPIDFTFEAMEEAEKNLKRVYTLKGQLEAEMERSKWSKTPLPEEMLTEMDRLEADWKAALEDDLNTAAALGHVFGVVRLAGRVLEDKTLRKGEQARELFERIVRGLHDWGEVFGVFNRDSRSFLEEMRDKQSARKGVDPEKVQSLIDERNAARKEKNFARADEVRDELSAMGVAIRDTPQGTEWDIA